MKFIEECLSNSDLSKVAFINKVLTNPEKFQISFDKWSKQTTPLLDVDHPQD
jgi:hypothetical protein